MSLAKHYPSVGPLWRRLRAAPGALWRVCSNPRSWVTWRRVRRVLVGVAALATLVALFYAVENWRGRRAWDAAVALARARGEPATLAELAPPPLPDAENFAAAPIVASLFEPSLEVKEELQRRWALQPGSEGLAAPAWSTLESPDQGGLAAWLAYLGTDDLIGYLERYRDDLEQITEASGRPKLRRAPLVGDAWTVHISVSGSSALMYASILLRLRAEARLEQGDRSGALEDILTQLRLAGLVSQEPFWGSQLMAAGIEARAGGLVRIGIKERAWTAEDLEKVGAILARLDILGGGWVALRTDSMWIAEILRDATVDTSNLFRAMGNGVDYPGLRIFEFMPTGWWLQNGAFARRNYVENVFPLYDATTRRVDLAGLKLSAETRKSERWAPYRFFAHALMVTVDRVGHTVTRAQTRIDLTRTALALERWRLSHGEYPAALAEVPAEWGVGDLHDLATGEPFHYRRDEHGGFLLYAIGSDGVDDGGQPADTAQPWTTGDWVW